jgi:hypothetical protein
MWWLIGVGILCIGYAALMLSGLGERPSPTPSKVVVSLSPPMSIRRPMKALIKALKARNKVDEMKNQTDKGLSDSTIKRIQEEGTRYTDK